MNNIQEKFERWKIEREVDQYNESYQYREGYVKAMCDAINLVKGLVIPDIVNCSLEDLKNGDTVVIEHAHKFENGYWDMWTKTTYKYLGCTGGVYEFENINYPKEHFRLMGDEPMYRFIGSINFNIK